MVQQLKSTIVVISQLFNFMNLQPRSDISDTRFIEFARRPLEVYHFWNNIEINEFMASSEKSM